MSRPQLKRWQIYRMHKGSLVQCGQVSATNQPQALRKACEKWSVHVDRTKPGFGFVAREV